MNRPSLSVVAEEGGPATLNIGKDRTAAPSAGGTPGGRAIEAAAAALGIHQLVSPRVIDAARRSSMHRQRQLHGSSAPVATAAVATSAAALPPAAPPGDASHVSPHTAAAIAAESVAYDFLLRNASRFVRLSDLCSEELSSFFANIRNTSDP